MLDVNWKEVALVGVGLIGYWHLVRIAKRRDVSALVHLFVESTEKDDSGGLPKLMEIYSKTCPFLVTPVPGMEFLPASIESAEIIRVKIDDQGLLEVICEMKIPTVEREFEEACKLLEKDGWRKKTYF